MTGETGAGRSAYDAFAPIYNRHWQRFSALAPDVLDAIVLKDLPSGAHVLDLCCGTGQLARLLLGRGFRVTGVDGSARMLDFARENAPAASLICADARDFVLSEQVDAVVSTSDSLNHVTEPDGLAAVFRCVRRSLRDGGVFVFDLNTEEKYLRHWTGSFGIVEDDQVCVVQVSYDQPSRIASFHATMFFQRGGWEREDLTIDERCYSEHEVRAALAGSGFSRVAIHDWRRDFDPAGEPAKIFVVCRG